MIPPASADLEARLDKTRQHLTHLARHLAGPDATPHLLAAAYDTVASVAQVAAAEARGERPVR